MSRKFAECLLANSTRDLRRWFARLVAAALLSLAGAARVAAAGLPSEVLPAMCGVQLKGHNTAPADLDQIQALGLKLVRRGFIWEAIEQRPGEYDFAAYDRLVQDCRQRGLMVLACMAFGNKLYGKVTTEAGRAAYARFAAALAAHYKEANVIFEIWNEPNVRTFWGSQSSGTHNSEQFAEEYVALVRATVPAMKRANPGCLVMAGSVSGLWSASFQWQESCFAKGILQTGIDAWSVHPYSSKCPEDVIESYGRVRALMAAHGAPKEFPLLNSERGYPLGKAEGYAGGDAQRSQEYQAWHVVRQYLVDRLCGVRLTTWYEWSGKEGFSLYQAGRPLPAYNACKVLIQELTGYHLVRRVEAAAARDFVLLFENGAGARKLVAWTAPPPNGTPDQTREHAVVVACEGAGAAGGREGAPAAGQEHIRLQLGGAPQYVALAPGLNPVKTTTQESRERGASQ